MSTSTQYPQAPERDHSSGADQQSASNQGQHKRVYQACIPCRRRKVKCDLGSVDNPGDPPCVRCRRESKECYFSATRRKRKLNDGEEGSADGYDFDDDYIVRNGRKRLNSNGGVEPPRSIRQLSVGLAPSVARYVEDLPQAPLTPGGHIGRTQPLRRPQQSPDPRDERNDSDANVRFENPEAQDVMRQQVYGPHDALDLLYKAATDSPGHKRARSSSNVLQSPITGNASPSVLQRSQPRSNTSFNRQPQHMRPPAVQRDTKIDPALTSATSQKVDRTQDPGYKDAIRAWSRFRFVRAGWFTPAEAIEYLEYYYEYLSPLTPISPPTFRNPGTHSTLLTEEPILTVTLLTIASRYRQIPGAGGHCRSHAIHEQLWTYLRGMVERCLWGQEAFGGGFCGSGALDEEQSSSTAPWRGLRKGSLRTLGTVESLMILTEWHPRALHFPPQDATDELMLPSYDGLDNFSTDEEGNHKAGGVGGKRIESWLEPAWRSDRMCWMLLSNAMGLSYELGVFDNIEELLAAGGDITRPEYEDEAYRLRAARIKKLLLIYVTQLAGRLGWTNMVPEHLRSTADKMESRKRRASDSNTPGTSTSISNAFQYIPDLELDDQIIHCWSGITTAMRIGNERIFKSRSYTTEIIQSGKYIALLKDFQPMLKNWRQTFEGFRLPPYIRHILTIEFEYVRIYINSLSLQAVVERSTGPSAGTLGPLSPETQNYYGKLPLAHLGGFGPADQEYVREVVDGSRNLLRTVVDGLLPGGFLKHAPVRTYFRIISGAMFLLKTFALGASKNDVEVSIGLMDRAVDALRTCVVDDVHLGIRFADLLETLTSRLRNRFMHAPAATQGGDGGDRASPRLGQGIDQRLDAGAEKQGWVPGTPRYQEPHILVDHNAGISSTEFDLGTGAFYPNPLNHGPSTVPTNNNVNNSDPSHVYDMQSNNANSGFGGGPDWIASDDLWYLPAGAAFFQNQDQAVTQTAEGINVGGMDLLDYMTLDQNFGLDGVGF